MPRTLTGKETRINWYHVDVAAKELTIASDEVIEEAGVVVGTMGETKSVTLRQSDLNALLGQLKGLIQKGNAPGA